MPSKMKTRSGTHYSLIVWQDKLLLVCCYSLDCVSSDHSVVPWPIFHLANVILQSPTSMKCGRVQLIDSYLEGTATATQLQLFYYVQARIKLLFLSYLAWCCWRAKRFIAKKSRSVLEVPPFFCQAQPKRSEKYKLMCNSSWWQCFFFSNDHNTWS